VLEGFATIGTIIALGFVLAHIKVLEKDSQVLLSRLSFFVASPALMVTVLGNADIANVFSKNLAASAGGVAVTGASYVALARLVWRKNTGDTVIGTLCSAYVNAGNLGLPIASYVLGDAALVAPILLLQLLVLQPLVLVGGMAVPAMLLAYGVSLRFGPLPGTGVSAAEIACITVLKMIVQPVAAYLIARFALGLDGTALFAVTILAALPTAQNIFVHATRYGRSVVVARDSIFLTTVLSVPAVFVITAVLA